MTLRLRPIRRDDLERTQEWHSDPAMWARTGGRRLPVTDLDEAQWYERLSGRNDQALMIVENDDTAVGLVGIYEIDWIARTGRTGLMIDPAHHGQGLGTTAYQLLIDYAEEQLGLLRLWAMIVVGNDASRRLHESLGYGHEGVMRRHWFVDGRHTDVDLFGRVATD